METWDQTSSSPKAATALIMTNQGYSQQQSEYNYTNKYVTFILDSEATEHMCREN